MNITLKDIETISEVAEIAEGKNILNSVKAELSSQAQILLNTDQSCIEICDSWAKKNGLLFIYSIKKCGLQVDIETLKHIDPEFLSIYKFLPLKSIATSDNVILLNDPFDLSQIQEIAFVIGYKKYKIGYTNNSFLLNEITKTKTILQDVALSITNSEEASASSQNFIDIDVIDSNSESAAVYFVNNALKNAISLNASDAHFESKAEGIATRIRIDGEMRPQFHASNTIKDSIIARLKVTSGLDASETRLPQDGRIKIRISEQLIDLRVSCVPSLHGERIVIRFLGSTLAKRASTVFFRENINELFRKIARTPEGMVIITGPTGSGKTTTLYHIIDQINRSIKNVVTIEDPIEREIEKASQIQINTTHNFDFSDAL
ncbi:MAG: Flp pilus assembly complex ATPase component TadA, partial [Chlamydiia bacterium]|nr:Flp pilus assembly complex ATPase component TadA [Chlamydiia bacterium]